MAKSQARTAQPSRPRGRPRGASRLEEVLTVAAARFTAQGYAQTTLEDIGAALGMTRPALYYYARSKEDLLVQCYEWTYRTFMDRLEGALTGGTGRARLEQFFAAYADIACDDVIRCFLSADDHHLSPERRKPFDARVAAIMGLVGDILDQGAADGSLAFQDKRFAIAALFGAFNSLPQLVALTRTEPAALGRGMMAVLLQGLIPHAHR